MNRMERLERIAQIEQNAPFTFPKFVPGTKVTEDLIRETLDEMFYRNGGAVQPTCMKANNR